MPWKKGMKFFRNLRYGIHIIDSLEHNKRQWQKWFCSEFLKILMHSVPKNEKKNWSLVWKFWHKNIVNCDMAKKKFHYHLQKKSPISSKYRREKHQFHPEIMKKTQISSKTYEKYTSLIVIKKYKIIHKITE